MKQRSIHTADATTDLNNALQQLPSSPIHKVMPTTDRILDTLQNGKGMHISEIVGGSSKKLDFERESMSDHSSKYMQHSSHQMETAEPVWEDMPPQQQRF